MQAHSPRAPISVSTSDEVCRVIGPVSDHTLAEVLALAPTLEDLQVAVVYARGEGDLADREGHPLTGNPARIYEILTEDDAYRSSED
ncbi:MAG: hypothetical protein SFW09_12565 [Hyphomicrobiaceae bacterium]|nr:hypothetical protein [Hyphomicrobiaceae bacterium]